jgi:hypothetical protein
VTLESPGGPTLLFWTADRATWNAATRSITLVNADGSRVTVSDGDAAVLGGGGESGAESGTSGEDWVRQTAWVVRPRPSCPLETRFGVGYLRRTATGEAAPTIPLPPPDTGRFGRPWFRDGGIVPPDVLSLDPGPGHCDWDDMLILRMNVELGRRKDSEETLLEYVRDPQNRWAVNSADPDETVTLGRFEPSVSPPDDVTFTGYVYFDGMELWRSKSATTTLVFLRRETVWEQWPQLRMVNRCM